MKIARSVWELVGKTPLLELCRFTKDNGIEGKILAKLESMNPAGSVKDRAVLGMLEGAERRGELRSGVIVEPTSGNTGIALAALAAARGYRAVLVMPDTMSAERIKLMRAYGAEVVLTDGRRGMRGAIGQAKHIAKERGAFLLGQFDNPDNPDAHERTTAPEIYEATEGKFDDFVAGVGTGGTLTGVGRYLKRRMKAVKVIAAEPASSSFFKTGKAGPHGIQGIGAGFAPAVCDISLADEIIAVSDVDAIGAAQAVAEKEGVFVGISSGAALFAAAEVLRREAGKTAVVLLPDSGDRYLSTPLCEN